ncbi:uncharacterized protein PV07_00209 [Cladophialophora immunda]|uniref:Transcription factor CBF/NF-Y/archaeal histone domain-containing protein n=1 Tax=Cladophialophora immunda TaxID=569365 RepID=A0A0D2B6W4_9EURO|nr:uncharacterized protein PV07_00209 [Cladophialophora immunda]KIW33352.1 hypothetical protein PV07_00209 [Cladophialophora immunda]OQU97593.1 hypothetical protein CLAIMM_03499 isoform 1 [Cladophialophora immunda]
MPYNNAPIEPPEEITGTTALPLARVKKVIAQDEDISQCSNPAAFAISVATEIFIRYLTEQAHNVVKSERKPRRNIAYKDIATAVSRIDNLEFLSDTVPKTKTYRQFKEEKAREAAAKAAASAPGSVNGVNGSGENGVSIQTMMKNGYGYHPNQNGVGNGVVVNGTTPERAGGTHHQHHHSRNHSHPDPVRDIEMSG